MFLAEKFGVPNFHLISERLSTETINLWLLYFESMATPSKSNDGMYTPEEVLRMKPWESR